MFRKKGILLKTRLHCGKVTLSILITISNLCETRYQSILITIFKKARWQQ
jgi:hypothetical protein